MNNDNFTGLVSGGGIHHSVSMCTVWPSHSRWLSRAMNVHRILHYSAEAILMIQKATAMDNWWLAASSWQCACSCIMSCVQVFVKTSSHPGDSVPSQPRFGALCLLAFPKTKITLKRKKFQTIDENQENTMGQLMVMGRTVWDPKVPTLKGTEASLSSVQCFLYLVSSSIYVTIFLLYGWMLSHKRSTDISSPKLVGWLQELIQNSFCFSSPTLGTGWLPSSSSGPCCLLNH